MYEEFYSCLCEDDSEEGDDELNAEFCVWAEMFFVIDDAKGEERSEACDKYEELWNPGGETIDVNGQSWYDLVKFFDGEVFYETYSDEEEEGDIREDGDASAERDDFFAETVFCGFWEEFVSDRERAYNGCECDGGDKSGKQQY